MDLKKVVAGLALLAESVLRAPWLVVSGWWLVVVFVGWQRDTGCGSVGVVCAVVKDQGGRLLTAIGGDGGAEDRMVLGALRHQIGGLRNQWPGGLYGLLWLHGLLLALGLALFL